MTKALHPTAPEHTAVRTALWRARFIEDLVETKISEGVQQYVILGAGLDTFAFCAG